MEALTKFNTFIWARIATADLNFVWQQEAGAGAGAGAGAAISVQSNNYVSRCYPNLRAPEQRPKQTEFQRTGECTERNLYYLYF